MMLQGIMVGHLINKTIKLIGCSNKWIRKLDKFSEYKLEKEILRIILKKFLNISQEAKIIRNKSNIKSQKISIKEDIKIQRVLIRSMDLKNNLNYLLLKWISQIPKSPSKMKKGKAMMKAKWIQTIFSSSCNKMKSMKWNFSELKNKVIKSKM